MSQPDINLFFQIYFAKQPPVEHFKTVTHGSRKARMEAK